MKMDERELLALVEDEERNSLAYLSGELSDERSHNMELFMGDKTRELAPAEGRSSVISMDVMEAVEAVMPSFMKVFCGGDEVVRFDPTGPEDVQAAEQETDYVNYVVTQQNNWYLVCYQWIKDALINKNAYVKFWWDESEDVTEETYDDLTDVEFQMLLSDENVEPIEHEEEIDDSDPQVMAVMQAAQAGDPMAIQMLPTLPRTHSVKIKRKNEEGKVKIEPCAPEEILVSADERSLDPNEVRFIEHRTYKTISELREMGYDVPDDISGGNEGLEFAEEWLSRQQFAEEEAYRDFGSDIGVNRRVVYREAYMKVDFDGDGIAERRMVCIVGDTILANEAIDIVPFAAITPFIMPHMHIGKALADYVKDVQIIKTTVLRNMLDNMYAQNNSRTAISDKVNLDDLLVSRPGGIIRVKGNPGAEIMPMPVAPLNQSAYPMMEYLDTIKETRTGITKYNQGMDANSLNKTATGISQIMSAAQQRQELMARTFAETGIKQLFLGVHKLLLQNQRKPELVRLRNQWVPVDPSEWKNRKDMTVVVGLGTGNKQEMLVQIMAILNIQKEALQIGIATPQNIYAACVELTKNAGFKDADKYWTNPSDNQQQGQQQPDPKMLEAQAKMQLEQQKAQADYQQKQQQMQMDYQLAQEKMIKEIELSREQMMKEIQIHREKVMAEIAVERERLRLQARGQVMKAGQAIYGGISVPPMQESQENEMMNYELPEYQDAEAEKEKQEQEMKQRTLETLQSINENISKLNKPKKVVRDKTGKIIGAE